MILVTGATGTVGKAVLEGLAGRGDVLKAVRDRDASHPRSRWFDFDRPETYWDTLQGVHAIFLLLPPGLAKAQAKFRLFSRRPRRRGCGGSPFCRSAMPTG